MRVICFLILSVSIHFAQDYTENIFISADSLKKGSISFNHAWRYSSGDDTLWSQTDFDDSEWDTLNPGLIWGEYDTTLWKGIGWFRKDITIDSALHNSSVALSMNHTGASEIYLNGKLIKEYGRVSAIPDSEKVYHPNGLPFSLNFGTDTSYVIAVRYSNHKSVQDPEWVDHWYGHHGFWLRLNELDTFIVDLILEGKMGFGVNFLIGGIFLSLAILYFLLYLFYSSKKVNLYYALFSFSLALIFPAGLLRQLVFENLNWLIIFNVVSITALGFTFIGYLSFVYSIFYEKIPRQIWFFIGIVIVMGIILFISPLRDYLNYVLPVFIFLAAIEGFRVIIIAIKNKKENSWVIGAGVIVFVSLILTIFILTLFNLQINNIILVVLFIIGLFGLPSSMSVYLAKNIASTNKKLQDQVVEIKELSEKELKAQQKNAELQLKTEREISAKNEAELRAKAAELQAKAGEAERRMLHAENERKSRELEEARNLQLSMLPKELPKIDGIDIAVHMETATEVGGDYYDFYEGEDGELTILIGDATGHGLNAGTMVTATKSLFNSYGPEHDIINTFEKISYSLRRMNFKFLSMCLMLLKMEGHKIRLSSAGMPPALIFRKKERVIDEILIKGMPLGSARAFPYEQREFTVNSGDTLLLMSDGLPELFNGDKEMYGYKNIKNDFLKFGDFSSKEIIAELRNRMNDWSGGNPPHDDVTLIVIKVN